ncbi:MAG: hypothetical protein VXZ99_06760, partial [Pseudomonadota bacterium]|nr:hypothetical protein [Pseudomonadota bacterium]
KIFASTVFTTFGSRFLCAGEGTTRPAGGFQCRNRTSLFCSAAILFQHSGPVSVFECMERQSLELAG